MGGRRERERERERESYLVVGVFCPGNCYGHLKARERERVARLSRSNNSKCERVKEMVTCANTNQYCSNHQR